MMYRETEKQWVAALVDGIVMRLHILSNLNLTHHYQKAVWCLLHKDCLFSVGINQRIHP
jgi:hypothetical protein